MFGREEFRSRLRPPPASPALSLSVAFCSKSRFGYLTTEVSIPVMRMTLRKIAVKLGVGHEDRPRKAQGGVSGKPYRKGTAESRVLKVLTPRGFLRAEI